MGTRRAVKLQLPASPPLLCARFRLLPHIPPIPRRHPQSVVVVLVVLLRLVLTRLAVM